MTDTTRVAVAPTRPVASTRHVVFARVFALAALFHLAGNPRPPWTPDSLWLTVVQVGVGVAAAVVLLRPKRPAPLAGLCVLVPASAWLEAPFLGNHWLPAAALGAVYLLSLVLRRDAEARLAAFLPAARLTLLIAYGFAAFSKLNTGFLDPVTSCAAFYQDQLVQSWGLAAVSVAERPGLATATAVGAAALELSVPVLLAIRRTRSAGVLLAMTFHWMLAMDLHQHFWDFSAVLFAGFLLFLDDEQTERLACLAARARDAVRASVRGILVTVAALCAVLATAAAAVGGQGVTALAVLAGHVAWITLGTGILALVWVSVLRSPRCGDARALRPAAPLLLVVPLLVAANGVTPYLELKTGYAWTMYSNLRTVAGETNHLLVPRTWDLTGAQRDLVEVVATSDPGLRALVGSDRRVVWSELREYAAENRERSLTYRRGAATVEVARLGDDPGLAGDVGQASLRLQPFRTVSVAAQESCQDVYTPAR